MSAREEPASGDIEADIHSESNDRSTLLPVSQPESESHFKSQLEQRRELLNVKELDWIREDEWTIHIQENSSDDDRLRSPSIFRVPNVLLKDSTKREAYVPTRVSLGPYHHRSAELPPMNSHKGKALRRMMTRFNENFDRDPNDMHFSVCAKEEILELDKKIRNSYEEKIDCDANTLALMLSLDGCFILEILRTLSCDISPGPHLYEPVFDIEKIDLTGRDILSDILKLENQIPLVVLEKLLKLEVNSTDIDIEKTHLKAFIEQIFTYFCPFPDECTDEAIDEWSWPQQDQEEVHHILDLVHIFIVPPQSHNDEPADQIGLFSKCAAQFAAWCKVMGHQDGDTEWNDYTRIPHAVELRNVGIKFKKCVGINNIKFDENSATMFLPSIMVVDSTEFFFRNLIAFEMCKPSQNKVTCYASIMDKLIDSKEDVALLSEMGIITNYIGCDADVAELFNGLCNGVVSDVEGAFPKLIPKLNSHYKNKVKVRIAELMKEHFSSPWRALALVGAIVILLLTFMQTVFSGLSVPYK